MKKIIFYMFCIGWLWKNREWQNTRQKFKAMQKAYERYYVMAKCEKSMTYKQFVQWCNERACDGRWGFITVIQCINALKEVNQSPWWKREKVWQKVNMEHRIVENYVQPTNRRIEEVLSNGNVLEVATRQ